MSAPEPDIVREFLTIGQPGYVAELDPKSPQFNADKYKIDVVNRIGARFENRFNEFQSVSQTNQDDPTTIANTSGPIFKSRVATTTATFALDPGQMPNADHVLNRAGAVTCGGCHQFSGGGLPSQPARQIGSVKGQPIEWPGSAIFVQGAEDGTLSTALNDFFLPFRGDRLRDAVCIPSPPLAVAGAGTARLPVEAFGASRTLAFEAARQARWQQLVRTAREQKDEIVRRQLHGRPFGLLVFNGRRRISLIRRFSDVIVEAIENNLTADLEAHLPGNLEGQRAWALRLAAIALHQLKFERIHRQIFGSQIGLLKRLNVYGPVSVEECHKMYNDAASQYESFFRNFTFKQWGTFLISNGLVEVPGLSGVPGMLEPKSDTLVSITPKGRMFLAYMNAHGLMERKVG